MRDLAYELLGLTHHNRDGSWRTQADRRYILLLCAKQLGEMGYPKLHATEFGQKHCNVLLARWKQDAISAGTLANRMAALRWWAEKVGRPYVMAKHNAVYEIEKRERVSAESKGKVLQEGALLKVSDLHIRMSLRMIQAYGLRRKEALLIRVHQADKGDHLALQGQWCKSGRARTIAIVTQGQRATLDAAKVFIRNTSSSLIPDEVQYKTQRRKFDYWIQQIGLGGAHGLRHAWAEQRYEALSGMPCPHRGGPLWQEMTEGQRQMDQEARIILSGEMGHGRLEITDIYVGRREGLALVLRYDE